MSSRSSSAEAFNPLALSRTSSATVTVTLSTVEVATEDIILVTFNEDDARNPAKFSHRTKWLITVVASTFTLLVSAATTSYNMGFPSMMRDLNCTQLQATLGLTLFGVGFAVVPPVTSSFSEEFGRMPLYIVSIVGFSLTHLLVAVAQNIETVIVARALQGAFGSTGATLVAGTIADIWEAHERGRPMTFYSVTAFSGNALGACMSGWIEMNPRLGWRWIAGIPCLISFLYAIVMCICLRETRTAVLLRKLAQAKRKVTGDDRYRAPSELSKTTLREMMWVSCTRPLYLLVTEPIVLSASLWIGFAWGVYFCMIQTIPAIFRNLHSFNAGQVGTVYLTMIAGALIGSFSNVFQERLYRKYQKVRGPEARLFGACFSGILFPAAMFLFAFTLLPSTMGVTIFAITIYFWSAFLMYLSLFTYLADCYGIYASSALAGQSLFRTLVGSVFPLFVDKVFAAMTYKWANVLFAGVAVLLTPVPFVLFFWGSSLRMRSAFAQSP
ncbi:MFS general substrate transporter [Pluteus cervinus]|uniref:MFS general substrate transporter n=1 Tax=Pluteus cervinus TaxID=181527 RepID=A0ACD3AT00_9AGAR|nr:MFS general substrate transporter [Pluteus cervinus]